MERFEHFAFEEVVNEEGQELEPKVRYTAILATLLGCQGTDAFRMMLPKALDAGVTPVMAKEIVYQATTAMEDRLEKEIQAQDDATALVDENSRIRGIYGCNNTSTTGIVKSLLDKKRTDIVMVGFDLAEETKEFIQNPDYHGVTLMQKQEQLQWLVVLCYIKNKKLSGRRTILLRLSGFPCQASGVWTGTKSSTSDNFLFYVIKRIALLFSFVKNLFVSKQPAPFFVIDSHKSYNGIFKGGIIF